MILSSLRKTLSFAAMYLTLAAVSPKNSSAAPTEKDSPRVYGEAMYGYLGSRYDGRPDFSYAPIDLRVGRAPASHNGLDYLAEISYAQITEGAGTYLYGIMLFARKCFADKHQDFVPYASLGLGLVLNDVYKTETYIMDDGSIVPQDNIGLPLEFNIRICPGIQYKITRESSVIMEIPLDHISNADLDERNQGFTSIGLMLGMRFRL